MSKVEDVAAAIGFVLDNRSWDDCGEGFKEVCRECAAAAVAAMGIPTGHYDVQRLQIGSPVRKVRGYGFPGEIVSIFATKTGNIRFVVEATGQDYGGMLHIFNGDQLASDDEH
ncbi:hypothetical protein G9X67_14855 [Rhizobium sp. WYCCWR 11152]|uniref:hypothetical protein n=1 Tax=Rhizobium sp. WYCCWR 11152 TaxID=2692316 RepID=UPI001492F521|nr:hypothetical protein [Rhizobium sp. WYCCWR 11152]NNU66553.1 hypothetical protein [Rhizobium sp. WYCCWR 11152]